MKTAKVTPLFKNQNPKNITNYRAISALPCFSKVLKCIVYNQLYKYLCKEKLYPKQFGFQKGHSSMLLSISLLEKLEIFGVNITNLAYFASY